MKKLVPMLLLTVVLATGCAAKKPILFDNAAYQKDPVKAQLAVDTCMEKAKSRGLEENRLAKAGTRAGKSAVASGAAGAAGAATANAFVGHRYSVGGSAGASAASGAAGSFAMGMMDNNVDEGLAQYVSLCLGEKGYKIVTWQ